MNGYQILIEHLLNYESDTFSASNSNLNKKEAEQVADALIQEMINTNLDGFNIDVWLTTIREDHNNEQEEK